LNFAEAAGEGKSLSMQDVRFARTILRIQQSLINELNKMAIVHLTLVGLEEELDSFQIALNNPSIQSDILYIELLQSKINLYKDLTDNSMGLAAMSKTKAKKEILGMSSDEIIFDAEQQRLERAIDAELLKTEQIITRTGLFDKVDKLYGIQNAQYTATSDGNPIGGEGSSSSGGGFDDLGGGMTDTDVDNMGDDLDSEMNSEPNGLEASPDAPVETPETPTSPVEPPPTEPNVEQSGKLIKGEILIEKINKLLRI
jgi:hypothetical protein